MDQDEDISRREAQWLVDSQIGGWKNAYRYDMAVFSNFLTTPRQVSGLAAELISVSRALRNGGIILIVGARGRHYPEVYAKIHDILRITRCKFIFKHNMEYSYGSRHGARIGQFLKTILDRLEYIGVGAKVDASTMRKLRARAEGLTGSAKWTIYVYRKGRLSRRRISYSNPSSHVSDELL